MVVFSQPEVCVFWWFDDPVSPKNHLTTINYISWTLSNWYMVCAFMGTFGLSKKLANSCTETPHYTKNILLIVGVPEL